MDNCLAVLKPSIENNILFELENVLCFSLLTKSDVKDKKSNCSSILCIELMISLLIDICLDDIFIFIYFMNIK